MYGDGYVYKEKVGKYQYFTCEYYDGTGKSHKKRFPATKDGEKLAKDFARSVRRQKEDGLLLSTSSLSVGEWIVEFMQTYLKPKYRPQTYERAKYTAKKLLPITGYPLDQITADQIQNLYSYYAETLKPATIYKIHKLLNAAFKKAVITRKIIRNPMDAVEAPKVTQDEIVVFTFAELLRLFRVLKRNPRWQKYYTFYCLLLVTGMRIGELCALEFEDIDFENREIHVCKTKVGRTGNKFNEPKTKSGKRYIPVVFPKALQRIRMLRHSDNSVTRVTGLLFRTRLGNAWGYNNVRRDWCMICEEAGVELKHIHAFRHTFATAALAKGIPILEVSRILGHSNANTTLKMYGHAMPGFNQRLLADYDRRKKKKTGKVAVAK